MFKQVAFISLLLSLAPAYAMPHHDLRYGDWKQVCGVPSDVCNAFLSGFLHSASFWKQWIIDSAANSTNPDFRNSTNYIAISGAGDRNGVMCLPSPIQFETVRQKVNSSSRELIKQNGGLRDHNVINHESYRVHLYDAFKNAYPCN